MYELFFSTALPYDPKRNTEEAKAIAVAKKRVLIFTKAWNHDGCGAPTNLVLVGTETPARPYTSGVAIRP